MSIEDLRRTPMPWASEIDAISDDLSGRGEGRV